MNKILLFILIISLLIIPSSASIFTDGFEDGTFNKWTTHTGTLSIVTGGSWDGSKSAKGVTNGVLQTPMSVVPAYWEYDFNTSSVVANPSHQFLFRYQDAGDNCFSGVYTTNFRVGGAGTCLDLGAYTNVPISINNWYHVEISDLGSTLNIKLYYALNSTLINEQNIADSNTAFDSTFNNLRISMLTAGSGMMVDNIFVDSVAPASATSNTISFNADQYFINDDALISWTISSTSWTDIFYFKTITLDWFDGQTQHGTTLVSSPTQTGTYSWHMDSVGTYTVNLNQRFLGIGSLTILATDTAITSQEAQSYINVNSTAFMRVPFDIDYNIGYSLAGYTSEIEVIGSDTTTGATIEALIIDATLGNTGTITAQQAGVKVWPVGRYALKLYDARKDKVLDTKYITIVNNPNLIPVLLFNNSSITTDRTFYFINDYMTVDFIVDDDNFTNFTMRADVFNYNQSITTKQFFTPFTDQAGSFETLVNSKINMHCDRGIYCWFEPGNNTIRLMAYNDTYSNILAYYNFTVSSTTVDGWGLTLSSNNISTTQELTIRTIVPSGQTGILKIRDAGLSPNATTIYQIPSVNEGTQTYKTTITRVNTAGFGYYEVEIIDASNNIVKMHLPLTVYKVGAAGLIPTSGNPESGQQGINNILGFMGITAFWGLVFWIVIVYAVSKSAPGSLSLVAFIAFVVELALGLFAPYTTFLFAIMVIGIVIIGVSKIFNAGSGTKGDK